MTYFTVITGAVTILSFLLQIGGALPQHKKYLSHATAVLLGLTAGMLLQMGASIQLTIAKTITVHEIIGLALVLGTGLLACILILTSVVVEDEQRRRTATIAASSVSLFLFLLLAFFWSTLFPSS
ncbi:MAG: hypothetical protein NTY19_16295 [Planctomycetota bacterium]|nr:hypothetical protein [Planctomycetota bacterium]